MNLISNSAQDTYDIGFTLGMLITSPALIYIEGQLGAGKTAISQGILRGLGIRDKYLTSPTYTIVNTYQQLDKKVYHFDVYRIEDFDELQYIGFDEYLDGNSTVIIEWADLIKDSLPNQGLWIRITPHGLDKRIIKIDGLEYIENSITQEFRKWEDKGENISH